MTFSVAGKLLDACVLGVVMNTETYGYDLTQKIGELVDVSESALYPVLRRLQKEGLLETYSKEYDGRIRKYYKITENGKKQQDIYCEEWKKYQSRVTSLIKGGEHD
ncbi:MAG: PadR family transcriptional regulator [Bacillota bacterium]